jgi:DNA-binding LytR/AlgR family response regulator
MKTVIVEDEMLAARNLMTILDELGTLEVVASLESIHETVEWFNNHPQPDLLFLDIHLADGSAFEIFDRTTVQCPVIFTTAYNEYALKAFKVNSIDYLLKPIDTPAVQHALNKLEGISGANRFQEDIRNLMASFKRASTYKTHFLVPVKGDKLVPVQTGDLACFFIDTGLVKAKTNDNKTFVFDHTLDELAGMLNPYDFFRANRQYIIARNAVKDIDFWFNSRLSVNLKITVPEKILISKARVPDFKRWFAGLS